jgi:hypothetical protein
LPFWLEILLVVVVTEGFVHLLIPRIRLAILDVLLRTVLGGFRVPFRAPLMGAELVTVGQTLESVERTSRSGREWPSYDESHGPSIQTDMKYVNFLLDAGLITLSHERGRVTYVITESGHRFLREFEEARLDKRGKEHWRKTRD